MTSEPFDPIARARKVADELQDTADSLYNVATEQEQNDAQFCSELDTRVFQCTCCSWWYEVSEMAEIKNDEWVCINCEPETE